MLTQAASGGYTPDGTNLAKVLIIASTGRSDLKALTHGLPVALVLFFVVMFLVLWVLYAILGIVRVLALLRSLILLAVFVLWFALLILCHHPLRLIDTVLRANVTNKKSLQIESPSHRLGS
jgi:hypothetical protein